MYRAPGPRRRLSKYPAPSLRHGMLYANASAVPSLAPLQVGTTLATRARARGLFLYATDPDPGHGTLYAGGSGAHAIYMPILQVKISRAISKM